MSEKKQKLLALSQWFEENPKLPRKIDPVYLRRFLKCMNYDLEGTKKLIETNYDIRIRNPQVFIERDPLDEEIEGYHRRFELAFLPKLTPEGYKILFFKANKFDAREINSVLECKVIHMLADTRLRMWDRAKPDKPKAEGKSDCGAKNDNDDDDDDDERISEGGVQVFDMEHITFSHFLHQSLSVVKMNAKYSQDAYPVQLRGIHMINCPNFIHKVLAVIRTFIRDEVFGLMHFHTEGIESLFEFVPRELLPNEYGGKAGTFEELKRSTKELLASQREYLMDEDYWKGEAPAKSWLWW